MPNTSEPPPGARYLITGARDDRTTASHMLYARTRDEMQHAVDVLTDTPDLKVVKVRIL